MSSGALMNVLYALLYVLALVLLVTGFILLRFVRRVRSMKGAILIEAKVVEIARFMPHEAEGTSAKAAKLDQYCPIYEALYENKSLRFRGEPSPNKTQWTVGEPVRLLYSPVEETAVEWSRVSISRIIGFSFGGLGLTIAVVALILQIYGSI